MNAHDRVERQLRTSVAHLTDRDGAPREVCGRGRDPVGAPRRINHRGHRGCGGVRADRVAPQGSADLTARRVDVVVDGDHDAWIVDRPTTERPGADPSQRR